MANDKDFKVKNGIQPTVYNEGVGTVTSGSEGYSLSNASYDSVSFSVSSQAVTPSDIEFKSDGTKMYILEGITNRVMYQYSLSTAFDITTASYDSVSFSIATQATGGYGLFFKGDGTAFYVADIDTETVYQYSLSTAWDLSTASYASKSFSISSQTTNPYGVSFKSDGTKMFVVASTTDSVYEYDLSTAWDVSTASYNSVSFSVTTQESFPTSLVFSSNGTKFFVGGNTDSFYEYTLSSTWDLSTATYSGNSFSVASQETNARGLRFSDDGTKMFVVGFTNDTIYQYSTVQTTAILDLSTGAVFDYTPTSDVQVTVSNPAASGTVSSATLLLSAEDSLNVGNTFNTDLYTGTGAAQTITNSVDLATDGGLVWLKKRDGSNSHYLFDTERGAGYYLNSDTTGTQAYHATAWVTGFNTDGFDIGYSSAINGSGNNHVAWTFKQDPDFFEVKTFSTTYNTTPSTLTHSLTSDLGMAIFKSTDATGQSYNWVVWHRSLGTRQYLRLNTTDSVVTDPSYAPTYSEASNEFTFYYPMSNAADRLISGGQETTNWVGYFFAHDTSADSIIKCGSYTGNNSTDGPEIDLGFEPQWLMIKKTDGADYWVMVDNMRGVTTGGNDNVLKANANDAELTTLEWLNFTPTGFKLTNNLGQVNDSGNFIYIAIRNPYIPTITYDTDLEWSGGTAPTAPAEGETDVITISTRDGGTTYQAIQAIDGAK